MRARAAAMGAALVAAAVLAGPAAAAPNTAVALGVGASANTLVRFGLASPGVVATVPVTGLDAGDTLVSIDHRPLDGVLYGVGLDGTELRVYTVDPMSGVATAVGSPFTVPGLAGATAFGFDANPVADRFRLVTNLASDGGGANVNNLRLSPAGVLSAVDPDLDFTGLPGGAGEAPLAALAYDRSIAGTSATTVFGLVSGADRLVRLGDVNGAPASANTGILVPIGPLGVNTSANAGLDIDPETGAAYAVLEVAGISRVYRVDLATGAATPTALDNRLGDGSIDVGGVSLVPRSTLALAAPAVSVTEGEAALVTVQRTGPAAIGASVGYAVESTASTTASGVDVPPLAGTLTFASGVTSATIAVPTTEDALVEGDETIAVRLSAPVDAILGTGGELALLTVVDDDPPPVAPPAPKRPPVGLVAVPTQAIDRSLSGAFSCTQTCSATLVLRLGTRVLATVRASLPTAGRRTVAFRISRANVTRIRTAALGPKSAKLRVSGTFRNADGVTRSELRFALG